MRINPLPPIDYLRQRLRYESGTGKLYWRDCASMPKSWRTRYTGREAFVTRDTDGYLRGEISGTRYRAHRIAWALHHGEDPAGEIDHINHDRSDNRAENLRVVSCPENLRNQSMYKNNTSSAMGVSWYARTRRWCAHVRLEGRRKHLGYFHNFEDAVAARRAAEAQYGFHANHGVEAAVNLIED